MAVPTALVTHQTPIHFEVVGVPAPQGSKTVVAGKGQRAHVVEAGSKVGRAAQRAWRATVADIARNVADQFDGPLDGPLELAITFRLPMPASRPKRIQAAGLAWSTVKPDLSKLIRSTEDALTDAGLIRDDARICYLEARKLEVVGWTGAQIIIRRPNDP
jgi:crossover junction endodeoxyribonuclease RusA